MKITMITFFSKTVCFVYFALLLNTSAIAGQYVECVGRYQLTFLGEVEDATTTSRVFGEKYVEYPTQFSNGQPAVLSSFYLNGEFEIFREENLSDYTAVKETVKDRLTKAGKKNKDLLRTEMRTDRHDSYAYFGAASSGFNLYEDHKIVTFEVSLYGDDISLGRLRVQQTLAKLMHRKDYEIPNRDGSCMPGIFVASEINEHREIGVTFRLKEHPDITILLKDTTSTPPVRMVSVQNIPIGRETNLTSREKNEFIWMYSGFGREVRLAHDPIPFHTVELDGRKGVGSFGTITRDDGSTDYAYLVTVQGDPNAKVDTPDLMLLVERTAKNAKGTPVSPDELKRIAKDIAASVKRRPIH